MHLNFVFAALYYPKLKFLFLKERKFCVSIYLYNLCWRGPYGVPSPNAHQFLCYANCGKKGKNLVYFFLLPTC